MNLRRQVQNDTIQKIYDQASNLSEKLEYTGKKVLQAMGNVIKGSVNIGSNVISGPASVVSGGSQALGGMAKVGTGIQKMMSLQVTKGFGIPDMLSGSVDMAAGNLQLIGGLISTAGGVLPLALGTIAFGLGTRYIKNSKYYKKWRQNQKAKDGDKKSMGQLYQQMAQQQAQKYQPGVDKLYKYVDGKRKNVTTAIGNKAIQYADQFFQKGKNAGSKLINNFQEKLQYKKVPLSLMVQDNSANFPSKLRQIQVRGPRNRAAVE